MVLVTVCLFLTSGNLLAQEKSNLLYQGVYKIQGTKAKDLINGYEVGSSFDANEKVEIYEDRMTIYFGTLCKYKSTNEEGERIYEGAATVGKGKITAYVSQSFKIRLTNETEINGTHVLIEIPVIKGRPLTQNYHPEESSSTSSGNPSGNGNNSNQRSYNRTENCPSCHGSKNCESCRGKGKRINPYTNKQEECPICHGTKLCPTCNGTGKRTKTVYY